ncbi:hypothetical protein [Oceanimonas smirnovii]|uniref:hypothetical protein n=1 Tax=Oceanimonas smirnovii TaxID=264574 RepID=UPI003FD43765
MNTKARSMDNGAACEKPKLHIQLAGLNHPAGQRFQIFEAGTDKRLTDLEATLKKRTLDDSVIYSWECKPHRTYDIALGIEAGGGSLSLPLFQRLRGSELGPTKKAQHNLVVPIVPLTWLPCYRPSEADNAIGACRSGYLYLFYQGKAWREIRVDTGENGYEFTDVDLNAFRNSDGFIENRRPASGNILEEIWLPAKADTGKGSASELLVAFSEVQWSAAYLTRLEQDNNECRQRCGSARAVRQWSPLHKSYGTQKNFRPLRDISLLRERDQVREYYLSDPWRYASDITGNYLTSLAQTAKSERESLETNGTSNEFSESALENGTLGLDHFARDWALQQKMQTNKKPEQSADEQAQSEKNEKQQEEHPAQQLFTKALTEPDLLAGLRPRELYTLVVEDTLFTLRHLFHQIQGQHSYLQSVLKCIEQHKHSQSAMLIQRLIMPETLSGRKNPLGRAKNSIKTDHNSLFMRVIREHERQHIHNCINLLQARLLKMLQRDAVMADLKDLATLDGADSGSLHVLVGQLLSSLVLMHQKADHLHHSVEPLPQQAGFDYLERILNPAAHHPLHALLFPQEETGTTEPVNDGTGKLTARRIKAWLPGGYLPEAENLQTQELVAVLEQLEKLPDNQLGVVFENNTIENDLFPNARRGVHFADGLLENISAVALAYISRITLESADAIEFNKIRMIGNSLESLANAIKQQVYPKIKLSGSGDVSTLTAMIINGKMISNLSESDADTLKKKQPHKATGSIYDESGNKLGSTRNKSRIKRGKNIQNVIMITTQENEAMAAHQKNTKAARFSPKYKLPLVMMAADLYNLYNEASNFEKTNNKRGLGRAVFGAGSALIDLSVMSGKLYIYLNQRHRFLTTDVKSYAMLAAKVDAKGKWMAQSMNRIAAAGLLAGGLTAAISFSDMFNAWHRQDKDAALAHGAITLGTLMGTFGGGLVAKGGVLLGLGPVGWMVAGITLAIAGGIALWFWESSDLELMLEKGVFGIDALDKNDDEELAWLVTDPHAAYAQLLNELVNLRIRIQPFAEIDALPTEEQQKLAREGADTCITVEYNLPPLPEQDIGLKVHVREAEKVTSSGYGFPTVTRIRNIDTKDAVPLLQYHNDGRVQYFYRTMKPASTAVTSTYDTRTREHYWLVRAQLGLILPESADASSSPYLWPRPPLAQAGEYSPENYHDQVSFKAPINLDDLTPFWANEHQHGVVTKKDTTPAWRRR